MRRRTLASIVLPIALILASPSASAQDKELAELADKLSTQIATAGRKVVAVVSFTNSQYNPDLSNFLIGRLNVMLSRGGKGFQIVTRSRIQEIMKERRLKYADSFDEKTFAEIGKLAGADSVISGEYSVFSNRISTTIQVLDVSTGRIIGGEILDLPLTSDMQALLKAPVAEPPVPGAPPSADNSMVRVVSGLEVRLVDCKIRADGRAGNRSSPSGNVNLVMVAGQAPSPQRTGDNLICDLTLKSEAEEREYTFLGFRADLNESPTRAIDMLGHVMPAKAVRLGHRADTWHAVNTLTAGIPMAGRVAFSDVPSDLSMLASVEIVVEASDRKRLKFVFRNVKVGK